MGLADMNLFSPSDSLYRYANAWNPAGVFSVAGHGNPTIMRGPNNEIILPEQLAAMIRANPNYKNGQPVMLGSCNTGNKSAKGADSFAQQLANALGAPVTGPLGTAWFNPQGLMGATPTQGEGPPAGGNPGPWRSFFPGGQ